MAAEIPKFLFLNVAIFLPCCLALRISERFSANNDLAVVRSSDTLNVAPQRKDPLLASLAATKERRKFSNRKSDEGAFVHA